MTQIQKNTNISLMTNVEGALTKNHFILIMTDTILGTKIIIQTIIEIILKVKKLGQILKPTMGQLYPVRIQQLQHQ